MKISKKTSSVKVNFSRMNSLKPMVYDVKLLSHANIFL
jgi:hypothetical protein